MPYTPMELANAFLRTGELDDALEALNAQLSQDATHAEARELRAKLFLSRNHLNDALLDAQQLPDSAEAHVLRSLIYERMEQLQEALAEMNLAREIAPQEERYAERVVHLYRKQSRWQDALAVIATQPNTWRWNQHEADICAILGEYERSITLYSTVIDALTGLIQQAFQKAFMVSLRGRVLIARAECYTHLKRYTLAQEDYLKAKKAIPDDPTIDFNLGVIQALEGNMVGAVSACREALLYASDEVRQHLYASLEATPALASLREGIGTLNE